MLKFSGLRDEDCLLFSSLFVLLSVGSFSLKGLAQYNDTTTYLHS